VLASSVAKTAAIRPLLIALLGLSILLLGVASLPAAAVPGPRMHHTLARHRLELAALGAGVLLAVAIAVLLG
jgi:type IV secretory pathway TrbD component